MLYLILIFILKTELNFYFYIFKLFKYIILFYLIILYLIELFLI